MFQNKDALKPPYRGLMQNHVLWAWILIDQLPNQQTHRRHATVDDGLGNRRGGDGFTVAASILRTDMAVDKEPGGFDIQLFGNIFANFDQVLAALSAFRFVAVINLR